MAVWRNIFGDLRVTPPFRERVAAIAAGRRPRRPRPADIRRADEWVVALTTGGLFGPVLATEFRWHLELDTSAVRRLFGTFSDWSRDEVQAASDAVDQLGGRTATAVHVQAPPVNDPGGEILFLRDVADPARALVSARDEAVSHGDPLVVVRQMVGDEALAEALGAAGYRRHCDLL